MEYLTENGPAKSSDMELGISVWGRLVNVISYPHGWQILACVIDHRDGIFALDAGDIPGTN